MAKVIKLIAVVDEATAEQIMALSALSPKEREGRPDQFFYATSEDSSSELHFVAAEVV